MGAPFADRFARVASDYARFRPSYPEALFDTLAGLVPGAHRAWDCATGSGQAATALAARFDRVVASDASAAQLAMAPRDEPRITYVRARAEAAPLAPAAVDLITVAPALHWVDIPAFWREARRVLAPGGIVAVWCYSLCRIAAEIDPLVEHFYRDVVGPFWAPQRALTNTGYRTVEFPFSELNLVAPEMAARLTLHAFLGYVGTWSASDGYRAAKHADPVALLRDSLAPHWALDSERVVRWPLHLRIGVR